MIEVMLLGVLVALIKIAELATVIPGIALFALGALVFLLAGDAGELRSARGVGAGRVGGGRRAARRRGAQRGGGDAVSAAAPTAMAARPAELRGAAACCRARRPATTRGAARAATRRSTFRKPDSLQRTWAFLIAAAICYVPANLLPVLTTTTAAGRRLRHHPAGRRAAVVADRLAAVAHRAVRQHHDPERARSSRSATC